MKSVAANRSRSLAGYIAATVEDIRRNGLSAVRRKAGALVWRTLGLVLYPAIVALRRLVHVRFMVLPSDYLGPLCLRPAYYLAERELGLHPPRSFDIFHLWPPTPCNTALVRVLRRKLRIWQGSHYVYQLYHRLPGGRRHIMHPMTRIKGQPGGFIDHDSMGVLQRTAAHVSLLPGEQAAGWRVLAGQDVPKGAEFVCFHARSSGYYRTQFQKTDADLLERRQAFRNTEVESYLPALETLVARRGCHAFRMSAVRERPLPATDPRIVDYVNDFRSPEMDVFLMANCRFHISCGAGPDSIAELFRRPVVFVNYPLLAAVHSWLPHVIILKRYWLEDEQRCMTFREIMETDAGFILDTAEYERRGIRLLDNTAEEIKEAVLEMDARLDGSWEETPEDEEHQARFWDILRDHPLQRHRCGFIAAAFLRRYRELLD